MERYRYPEIGWQEETKLALCVKTQTKIATRWVSLIICRNVLQADNTIRGQRGGKRGGYG